MNCIKGTYSYRMSPFFCPQADFLCDIGGDNQKTF